MPKKEYTERKIELVGRTKDSDEGEACPVGKEADDYLSSVTKHDNRVTYKKIEVDSEEGQEIADKDGIEEIPYITDCKTYKDGDKEKTRCRTISGYDEAYWSDLSKLVPKEDEQKEEEKAIDDEPSEPVEPSEPE